jgi:hypothetical protein
MMYLLFVSDAFPSPAPLVLIEALNVRLKPVHHSNLPHQANYSNVAVAQGMAYLEFGFLDPAVLQAIVKTAKDGQVAPDVIEGQLVTRVAMGVNVLARLHQQIQQVLVGLRTARQSKLTETRS